MHKFRLNQASEFKQRFSLPIVTYVGSDLGCSCGFRHISSEDGEWVYSDDEDGDNKQNHQELFNFIKEYLNDHSKIEIYTCWEGNDDKTFKFKEEIDLTEIINKSFRFKTPAFYIVKMKE